MEEAAAAAGRKRKDKPGEMQLDSPSIQLKTRRFDVVAPENSASPASSGNSTCESAASDHALASCCSSNGSRDLPKWTSKFVDLEEAEVTPKFFTTSAGDSLDSRERREMTPSSEVEAELGELESTARPRQSNICRHLEKLPSEAELEEFFSMAEQNLQKQFMDKYNFDIVKDQPLEGRYEWVQIKVSHEDEGGRKCPEPKQPPTS